MKKLILSVFVLVSFGFYVVWQKPSDASGVLPSPAPTVAVNTPKKVPKHVVAISATPVANNPAPPPVAIPPSPKKTGIYNDGTYIGDSVDAYYGYVQVKAIITNGRLANVVFLDYPQDRSTSVRINSRAMPILISEAISAQSANVNGVSGASATSPAFVQSLSSALAQAKA